MTTVKEDTRSPLITGVIVLLLIYNVMYWLANIIEPLGSYLTTVRKNWGLLTFLEFIAVISLVVDLTIRWDKFSPVNRRNRFILTILIAASFGVRFVFGLFALYMTGEAK